MKLLLSLTLVIGASIHAWSQDNFKDLIQSNINHYQNSEKVKYSIVVNVYPDSTAVTPISSDQMHYYKSRDRECVVNGEMQMIRQDTLLLSVMKESKVAVLQKSPLSMYCDIRIP